MTTSALEWSATAPAEPGLWWYRLPNRKNSNLVEYVRTDREPLLLYHESGRFRVLSDDHFDGAEWRGPVAVCSEGGTWRYVEHPAIGVAHE